MIHLNANCLMEDLLARSMGLNTYAEIMDAAQNKDVSSDTAFQHAFNGFYRVRRNAEWREYYYKLFERAKNDHYSFADVISCLYVETGNVEASFSSKMIATIDSGKPIWDQYVLRNLGLEPRGKNSRERIENAIRIYDLKVSSFQLFSYKNLNQFHLFLLAH